MPLEVFVLQNVYVLIRSHNNMTTVELTAHLRITNDVASLN